MMNTNTIKIKKFINGGYGLGRLENGRIVLLQGSLPGETVTYEIFEKKKNFLKGKVTSIAKPHELRKKPPCHYYGNCGGCNLQHCRYDEQLRLKDGIIRELVDRHSFSQSSNNLLLQSCLPSPDKIGYRQRIRLQLDANGHPGFLRFQSHEIIPITTCLVARPQLNSVLQQLQRLESYSQIAGHCREMELLFNPDTSKVTTLLHYNRKPRPADIQAATQLAEDIELLEGIFFKGNDFPIINPLDSTNSSQSIQHLSLHLDLFDHHRAPLSLSWEIGGFCQVNIDQNTQLVKLVLDICKLDSGDSVLDLFCGMGNFSIPLAIQAKSLVGVEGQGSAIRSAKTNSKRAGLENTTFFKSPVHTFCQKLAEEGRSFDWVFLDPPRQGVPGLARVLSKITRRKMVYISCDPATLCRDLDNFTQDGFTVKKLYPVDMFPQTHHIETVALLEKN